MRCDCCGKFISRDQVGQHDFVPDSDVSWESEFIQCKDCLFRERGTLND